MSTYLSEIIRSLVLRKSSKRRMVDMESLQKCIDDANLYLLRIAELEDELARLNKSETETSKDTTRRLQDEKQKGFDGKAVPELTNHRNLALCNLNSSANYKINYNLRLLDEALDFLVKIAALDVEYGPAETDTGASGGYATKVLRDDVRREMDSLDASVATMEKAMTTLNQLSDQPAGDVAEFPAVLLHPQDSSPEVADRETVSCDTNKRQNKGLFARLAKGFSRKTIKY